MQPRFDITKEEPGAFKAIMNLEHYVQSSGIEARFLNLAKIRTSQINGCAYCVDMHTKEAKKGGFSEQWIALIAVWHEAAIYDDRERAVLNWTESLTHVSLTRVPDEDYDLMTKHFGSAEIARLSVAISTINVWNRMALALRLQHPVDHAPKVGEAA